MSYAPLTNFDGYDVTELNRALDIAKTKAFLGDNGAFLGPLMCGMEFIWTKDVETAATDGIHIWWNPDDFLSLDEDLRASTVLHELWHPANLHFIRQGDRHPQTWNIACVPQGTKIAMADGSQKSVEAMEAGDKIKTVKDGTSTVALKLTSTYKEILEIEFENGTVFRCSSEHKVLTEDGFKTAAQLAIGSACFVDTRFNTVRS